MPRRNDQNIGRAGQAAERVMGHLLHVQCDIDGHLALILEIDTALVQHIGRDMHLGGAFRHRIAEGRKRQERRARLNPHSAGNCGAAFGDVGQVVLIRPFVNQRIAYEHDPSAMQDGGDAHRPILRARVEDVVDKAQHMRRFARRAGDKAVAMPMRQHQRGKDMPVPRGETVNVVPVEALALQARVKEILVGLKMGGVGGIDDLQLLHRIRQPLGRQLLGHVRLTPDDQRLAKTGALIGDGGAQHARIISFGKDHSCLCGTGAGMDSLQDRGRRVHPRLQVELIGLHVDDRPARDPSLHPGLRDGGRDDVDQTRVEGRRDDVVAPEGQLAAIGHRDLIRHILPRQLRQSLGTGDLHLVIDRAGVDVERAAEKVREPKDVVDLVGIVRPAGGDDRILAHGMRLFRRDFRVRVGHGENHRVRRHAGHHIGRHRALGRHAQEHVGALHRVIQRARLGPRGMGRFPLVHALGPALPDHALGVAHDAVVMFGAHGLEQFQTGDPGRPGPVQDDAALLDLLA